MVYYCFTHIILENCYLKKTPRFFGLMQNHLSRKGNNTCTTDFFKLTFFLLIPSRLRVALAKKRAFPLTCSLGTASMSGTYSTRRRFHEPSMSGFPSLWIGPGTSYGKKNMCFPCFLWRYRCLEVFSMIECAIKCMEWGPPTHKSNLVNMKCLEHLLFLDDLPIKTHDFQENSKCYVWWPEGAISCCLGWRPCGSGAGLGAMDAIHSCQVSFPTR